MILRIILPLLFLAVIATAALAEPLAHRVMVNDHPVRVWEKSAPDAQAVVLLIHGRTWSTRPDFDLQVAGEDLSLMDGLVQRGISVYGVDLRGYGETPRDSSGWLTPDRAVEDVAEVLRWLAARHPETAPPALFGWSYGAMVGQLTAQRHPELIEALLLFGYPVRPGIAVTPDFGEAPPRLPTTAAGAAEDFIVPDSISDAAIAGFVAAALAADPVRADWRELEQWRALAAGEVVTPTLLLEGEFDPLALDDVHARFFAELGTSDKAWVVFPDSDHVAFMETHRDYFLNVMAAFLHRR